MVAIRADCEALFGFPTLGISVVHSVAAHTSNIGVDSGGVGDNQFVTKGCRGVNKSGVGDNRSV